MPKRAVKLRQPVCGGAVTSITADPIARRVPGRQFGAVEIRPVQVQA